MSYDVSQKKKKFLYDAILPGTERMVVYTIPNLIMDKVKSFRTKICYVIRWYERLKYIHQFIAHLNLQFRKSVKTACILLFVQLYIYIENEPIVTVFFLFDNTFDRT